MKMLLAAFVLLVLGAVILVAQAKGAGAAANRAGAFRRRKLITENEKEFFGRLVVALPDHYIFPQVAMAALIEAASGDKKKAHGDRLRIAQQRADYVVCTRSCEVVAVVELDDRTHSRTKDQLRDSRLEQAGIRTVRFESRNKPTAETIRSLVLSAAPAAEAGAPPASAAVRPA